MTTDPAEDTGTTETTEAAQQAQHEQAPAQQTTPQVPAEETTEHGSPPSRLRSEAARYRRALREAEGERDALRAQLHAFQRAEAERIASDHLADASDLWRDGAELSALLTEDGTVDPGKIADTARTLVQAHPHWAKPPRVPAPEEAGIGVGGLSEAPTPPTFGDLLNKGASG